MSNSAFEAARRGTAAGLLAGRRGGRVVATLAASAARNRAIWALGAIALGAAIAAVMTLTATSVQHAAPAFLARSLGPEAPAAPLARPLGGGLTAAITPTGYTFTNKSATLSVASRDAVGSSGTLTPWNTRANGAIRSTTFGNEAVVFKNGQIEQLMTVGKHVGQKTWQWRLASNLGYPRVGDDGYVAFIKDHAIRQDAVIKPVVLFDAKGRDITPKGLRWSIAQDGKGYLLQLTLNDKKLKLPVPYVIDPITFRSAASTITTGDVTSITGVNKPAGVADGDLAVVNLASSSNTGGSLTFKAGTNQFSAVKNTSQNAPTVTHMIFFARILQTGDAAASWNYQDAGTVSDGNGQVSATPIAQSYAIITAAFTGVQAGSVAGFPGIDIANAANAAQNAPNITPSQNNEVVIWGFANRNAAFTGSSGGTEPIANGVVSTGGGTNNAATTLLYSIGSTAGTSVTGASVTTAAAANQPLATSMSFRIQDTTAPTLTADTVKVTANNTIVFDFDDGSGVGVAPTVPSAAHFSALYTPAGGGSQTLVPTTAAISATGSTGTVTLTFSGTPFTTPGSITLEYHNTATSTTMTSNFTTSGGTSIAVGSTANFSSTGKVLITGNSTGSLGVAYVYTPSAKSATSFTVGAQANLVGAIGSSSTVSNRLQDRDGNPLATFTTQQVYFDGSGTITLSPGTVGATSNNEMTFTFTIPSSGMVGGAFEIDTAAATTALWTTPQTTTNTAAGYVNPTPTGTATTPGTVSFTGGKIKVSGITGTSGQTVIVKYGDTSGGANTGAKATAPASAPTTQLFQTQAKSLAAGTLTNVATSPSVGVVIAPDGSGTMTVNPTSRASGSTGQTLTFTYTAATMTNPTDDAMVAGEVRLVIPSDWTTPNTTSSTPGFTAIGTGCSLCSLTVTGNTIKVTNVDLKSAQTFTIVYGSGAGAGVTVPSTPSQTATFTTTQRSLTASTLTPVATQPTVAITGTDGAGTLTVSPAIVYVSTTQQHVFTYTLGSQGMLNGAITIAIPGSWTTPQDTTATANGYATIGAGTATTGSLSISGSTITVDGITGTSGQTVLVNYGDTSSGASGATAPSSATVATAQGQQKASASGTLTNLSSSPTLAAVADGAGTITVSPNSAGAATNTNTFTFTYTAAAGGMNNGTVTLLVPTGNGWTSPNTSAGTAGYTTSTTGSLGVSGGNLITITGVTLAGGATFDIVYGSGGGSARPTVGTTYGTNTFTTQQKSLSTGTLANVASQPSVNVTAATDGGTSCAVTPTTVTAGATTTLDFTCTLATGGMNGGAITILIPSGWTAPQTGTNNAAGYTTVLGASTATTPGTASASGQTITVSGITGTGGQTVKVRYGDTGVSANGATTAQAAGGTASFTLQDKATSGGTLTNVTNNPLSVTVNAPDGQGSCSVNPTTVTAATPTTLTFTCTIGAGGLQAGGFSVEVPAGWTAPQTSTNTSGGYTTLSNTSTATIGSAAIALDGVNNRQVNVTNVTGTSGQTVVVVYGDSSVSVNGKATPPSAGETSNFPVKSKGTSGGTFSALATSPVAVTVSAPDGQGSCSVSPTTVATSTAATLTFTCTIGAGGLNSGAFAVTVPSGWTAPQTATNNAAGYTTRSGSSTATTPGTVSASGQVITVAGITGTSGQTVIIVYGDSSVSANGKTTSPATGGANNFVTQSKGTAGGTLTALSSSPAVVTTIPPDGQGTCSVSPTTVATSTAATLTFTCTIGAGGLQSGAFAVTVPSGWTAPQTATNNAAGYTTLSGSSTATTPGSIGAAGQVITVSGITGTSGQTVIVVYGDASVSANGKTTSPATGGANNFITQSKSVSGGTLTALASSPAVVTTIPPDGQGTCAVSPTTVATSTATTLTFTCTIGAGGLQSGAFTVTVPSGWDVPQTGSGLTAGYTTVSGSSTATTPGTASVASRTITVSGITGTSGQTVIIKYGDNSVNAAGRTTSPSVGGINNFATQSKAVSGGTLTTMSSSPNAVTVIPPDGQGTCSVSPTSVATSTATTLTFTCTIASGGIQAGAFAVTVPSGWTAPQTGTNSAAGYTTLSGSSTATTPGSVSASGQVITVGGITGTSGQTVIIVYGDSSASVNGKTISTSTAGTSNFTVQEKSTLGGTLAAISSSPLAVAVNGTDGSGNCVVSPTSVDAGTATTLTFTCTLAGSMNSGAFQVAIPAEWTAPQTATPTAAGYTVLGTGTATAGGLSVSGNLVNVTGVTGTNGQTVSFVYGSKASGGPGSNPPTTSGTLTFTTKQKATSGGTLTNTSTQPTVTTADISVPPKPNGGTVDDTTVVITFDGPIDENCVPPRSSLSVTSSATGLHNVIAVGIVNGNLVLTLDTPVTPGEKASAKYVAGGNCSLRGTNGKTVDSFTQPLTNKGVSSGSGTSPVGIPTADDGSSSCGSSSLFFMIAAYGSKNSVTLVFCRTFNETVTPAPDAFQVSTSDKGRVVPAKVAVKGSTVVLTLADPLVKGETGVVSYAMPTDNALVDVIKNEALSFMGAQIVNLTGGTATSGSSQTPAQQASSAAAVAAAEPKLLASSPDDGITVPKMLSVTLVAQKPVRWTNVRVVTADGTIVKLPDGFGSSLSNPFVPTQNGPYQVLADATDPNNGKTTPISTNYTVYSPPPAPTVQSAGTAPEVSKVTDGGVGGAMVAADGSASVSWPGTLFPDRTTVTVQPLPVVDSPKGVPSITANFAVGSIAIEVTARRAANGALIKTFDTPMHLEFPNGTPNGVPSYSPDGLSWINLPALAENKLPDGQKDGYFRDARNTVHVWTRHLTYFAILKPGSTLKLIAAPHIWAINKRRTIAFLVQAGRPVTGVAQLYVAHSKHNVTVWKPFKVKAGATVLRYYLPRNHKMLGNYELRARFTLPNGKKTIRIRKIEFLPKRYKPVGKRALVLRVNGLDNHRLLAKSLKKYYRVGYYRTGPTSIPFVAIAKKNVAAVVINLTRTPFEYNNRIALVRNLRWIFPDLRIVVITGNKKLAEKALQWGADAISTPPGGSWQLRLSIKRALASTK